MLLHDCEYLPKALLHPTSCSFRSLASIPDSSFFGCKKLRHISSTSLLFLLLLMLCYCTCGPSCTVSPYLLQFYDYNTSSLTSQNFSCFNSYWFIWFLSNQIFPYSNSNDTPTNNMPFMIRYFHASTFIFYKLN